MSVVTRNRNGGVVLPGSPTGRPLGPIEEMEPARPQLQRQAVIDQLGGPAPAAQPVSSGAFARGGQVKQLPGSGNKISGLAESAGAQVAGSLAQNVGKNIAHKGVESVASQVGGKAASIGAGAASLGAGAGISLATDFAAKKLRKNEEMPEFGGEFGHITDEYGRRFEDTGGGTHSNMVKYAGMGANPALAGSTMGLSVAAGALYGLGKAAINRHAPSAFTDFRSEDGAASIDKMYQEAYGRPATEDEIRGAMTGQGWDEQGGDRWMGEKPLNYVLGAIKKNGATEAAQRAALLNQLGSGEPTVETSVPAGATREGSASSASLQRPGETYTAQEQAALGQLGALGKPTSLPGAGPEAAAAGGAPPDSSGWETEGYPAPQFVPQNVGNAPPGWDAKNWADGNMQTPKYGVGRILASAPGAGTIGGVKAAMPDLERAYPGITFDGKDKLSHPDFGTVDVVENAVSGDDNSGSGLRWGTEAGDGAPAPGGGATGAGVDLGAQATNMPELDSDTLAKLKAELDRIIAGSPNREALMAQMGAA